MATASGVGSRLMTPPPPLSQNAIAAQNRMAPALPARPSSHGRAHGRPAVARCPAVVITWGPALAGLLRFRHLGGERDIIELFGERRKIDAIRRKAEFLRH